MQYRKNQKRKSRRPWRNNFWSMENLTTYFSGYVMLSVYQRDTIDKWTKVCFLLFPKRGDLRITKNYSGIILSAIAPKVYYDMLVNCIQTEIEKILRKNQNGFRRNCSTTSKILTIRWIMGVFRAKNFGVTLLFVDFSKLFNFIYWGKMGHILFAFWSS